MKTIFSNKKLILIILTIILIIILLFNYINIAETSLLEIFSNKKQEENLLFETDIQTSTEIKDNKIDNKIDNKKDIKIESLGLISEIKDPFAKKENKKDLVNKNKSAPNFFKLNEDMVFLEKNIIAEELKVIDNSGSQIPKVIKKEEQDQQDDNFQSEKTNYNFDENIKVPFELLGIIKNKKNSAALFLYQGKNILKKENDKIDIFKIEEIKNEKIILSYQNKIRTVYLWEEARNED